MYDPFANVTAADHVVGRWGPVTATLDWCEKNYQFTPHIAELANTFSNLITVAFAVHGARQALIQRFPRRLFWGHVGFALVGVGSFFFHATLRFEAQLADELPMVYVASYALFLLADTRGPFGPWTAHSALILAGAVLFQLGFTWTYWLSRNPLFHQSVFASIVLTTVARAYFLMHSAAPSTNGAPAAGPAVSPATRRTLLRRLFGPGAVLFAAGFAVWNADNVFCTRWTGVKDWLGWPAAFFLEGHAWWHVLTALGVYLLLQGVSYLALCVKDDPAGYELAYTAGVLPYTARRRVKAE